MYIRITLQKIEVNICTVYQDHTPENQGKQMYIRFTLQEIKVNICTVYQDHTGTRNEGKLLAN